jgi:protein involved in polysaccharide export with SLBB domain
MRKKLPLIVLAIAGFGLSVTASIRAQQPANSSALADDSNAKPCIVIYGAVRSPARFELRRRVRLAELLARSGGVTERVGKTIQIIHSGSECYRGGEKPATKSPASESEKFTVVNLADFVRGDEKANPYIEAGDVVIVTESDPIYVTGSVVNPRPIFSKGPLKLLQAIKLAGGLRADAKKGKVLIYRRRPNGDLAEEIALDLNEIVRHRTRDFILQPGDTVVVGGVGQFLPTNRYPTFDSRPLIPRTYRVIY